jgi:hypothetical protein
MPKQNINPFDPNNALTQSRASDQNSSANIANGMNPLGGWAGTQGFNPSALANTIYTQPFDLLPSVFSKLNTAGSGYQSLRDIGADPLGPSRPRNSWPISSARRRTAPRAWPASSRGRARAARATPSTT